MLLQSNMSDVVREAMKTEDLEATKSWLNEEDLIVYAQEYSRTGFEGPLSFFKVKADEMLRQDVSRLHISGFRLGYELYQKCISMGNMTVPSTNQHSRSLAHGRYKYPPCSSQAIATGPVWQILEHSSSCQKPARTSMVPRLSQIVVIGRTRSSKS